MQQHFRFAISLACLVVLFAGALASDARSAAHQSENFSVQAPTPEIAETIAVAAEEYRRNLAVDWLGVELPRWSSRCRITVRLLQHATSGDTTYVIHQGEVYGWKMTVQGPLDRIIESVLPHEISHTILASGFRGALPRWADEGAAVLCEGEQENVRRQLKVGNLLDVRQIPTQALLSISEYPTDGEELMLVYSQGYSLTQFLVEQKGKRGFVQFLKDASDRGWEQALERAYGFSSVELLDHSWRDWMEKAKSPANIPIVAQSDVASASSETPANGAQGD